MGLSISADIVNSGVIGQRVLGVTLQTTSGSGGLQTHLLPSHVLYSPCCVCVCCVCVCVCGVIVLCGGYIAEVLLARECYD